MKKILFIGHDGDRTGAPIVLLHFLRWFTARNPGIRIDLLLLRGGNLEDEYGDVCNVVVMPDRRSRPIMRRVAHRLKRNLTGSDAIIDRGAGPFDNRYDIVVGNTIATLDHLAWFKRRGARTIGWIHELGKVIGIYFTPGRLRKVSGSADSFVAASGAVRDALHGMGVSRPIEVAYEFSRLDVGGVDAAGVRSELGIPAGAFVVGGCGSIEPRKGVDLFVRLASRVTAHHPDVHFVWIGGPAGATETEYRNIQELAQRLSVKGKIVFTGITGEPGKYFAMLDVFALTSREDPFPLVCLEAAGLGKPLICFADAGGMPEFVGDDAGAVVPFGDLEAFADEILKFRADPDRLREAGRAARGKIEGEFSLERSCRRIEAIILGVPEPD